MSILGEPVVTWIKVQKPTFDLVGVILSSLTATALVAGVALVLGCLTGLLIVLHRRRVPARSLADDGLHLFEPSTEGRGAARIQ